MKKILVHKHSVIQQNYEKYQNPCVRSNTKVFEFFVLSGISHPKREKYQMITQICVITINQPHWNWRFKTIYKRSGDVVREDESWSMLTEFHLYRDKKFWCTIEEWGYHDKITCFRFQKLEESFIKFLQYRNEKHLRWIK